MTLLTINDYIARLKEHIEYVYHEPKYTVLLSPSPAQLREYCLTLCREESISNDDKTVLKDFFKVDSLELVDIITSIKKFDIEKFKPIQHFLNGKTTTSKNHTVIEMVALMYDYEMRPYGRFRKQNLGLLKEEEVSPLLIHETEEDEEEVLIDKQSIENKDETVSSDFDDKTSRDTDSTNKKNRFNILYLFLIGLVLGVIIFTVKSTFFDKDVLCMKWVVDKYVECDCGEGTRLSFTGEGVAPIKYSDNLIESFKKVEVDCNTIFFKNNKPKVWFVKTGAGQHEYFSSPGEGVHPTLGKPLKPITKYHLDKYIYPNCP